MRIPTDASPDVQQAFRDLNARVDTLLGGNNIDLGGRRIINAGDAVDPQDYATKKQSGAGAGNGSSAPLTVDVATINKLLSVMNVLRIRQQVTLTSPAAGVLQLTRGDGTTFATIKLAEVDFGTHARLVCTVDDIIQVLNHTGLASGDLKAATVHAATFALDGAEAYTPSNVTPLRTGDFSALSAADVRSILGTLITDLQAAGLLSS